ncbi:hypothetical protein, partial [Pseudomonas putida]|uniref:hypothetical protein n=1 Tax=Pseudomonas putida TaxID=303 RepID=UPI001E287A77
MIQYSHAFGINAHLLNQSTGNATGRLDKVGKSTSAGAKSPRNCCQSKARNPGSGVGIGILKLNLRHIAG